MKQYKKGKVKSIMTQYGEQFRVGEKVDLTEEEAKRDKENKRIFPATGEISKIDINSVGKDFYADIYVNNTAKNKIEYIQTVIGVVSIIYFARKR